MRNIINTIKWTIITSLTLAVFLTLSTAAIGQRDTTYTNLLKVYSNIDTTASGNNRYIAITYKMEPNFRMTTYDTINVTVTTVQSYIDSMIALSQADSVIYQRALELYYEDFKTTNTTYQNIKSLLAKLWAIRPD